MQRLARGFHHGQYFENLLIAANHAEGVAREDTHFTVWHHVLNRIALNAHKVDAIFLTEFCVFQFLAHKRTAIPYPDARQVQIAHQSSLFAGSGVLAHVHIVDKVLLHTRHLLVQELREDEREHESNASCNQNGGVAGEQTVNCYHEKHGAEHQIDDRHHHHWHITNLARLLHDLSLFVVADIRTRKAVNQW